MKGEPEAYPAVPADIDPADLVLARTVLLLAELFPAGSTATAAAGASQPASSPAKPQGAASRNGGLPGLAAMGFERREELVRFIAVALAENRPEPPAAVHVRCCSDQVKESVC